MNTVYAGIENIVTIICQIEDIKVPALTPPQDKFPYSNALFNYSDEDSIGQEKGILVENFQHHLRQLRQKITRVGKYNLMNSLKLDGHFTKHFSQPHNKKQQCPHCGISIF